MGGGRCGGDRSIFSLDNVRDVIWTEVAKTDIHEHAHHVPNLAVPICKRGEEERRNDVTDISNAHHVPYLAVPVHRM
jgi:hypothetical protein